MEKSTKDAETATGEDKDRRDSPAGLPRAAEDLLRRTGSPAAVVIDHDMRIIQVHGDPAPCVQDGDGDDLTERLHPDLADEALAMVQAATARGRSMERRGLRLREHDLTVSIEAMPLHGGPDASAYAMLVFRQPGPEEPHGTPIDRLRWSLERLRAEPGPRASDDDADPPAQTGAGTDPPVAETGAQSEQGLQAMDDLVRRNRILRDKNRDLTDMLASLPVPIVVLTSDLRIRDYTRPAERLFGLLPTDIGRQWTDLETPLDAKKLQPHVTRCVDGQERHWLRLRIDGHGRYRLGLAPLRVEEDRVAGAVAVFIPED